MNLYIKTEQKNGITKMTDCAFSYPYKVAKSFERGAGIELMVMSATPGVMSGDCHDFEYDIDGNVRITSQSYTKILGMENGFAKRDTKITVHENSFLDFSQTPVIPFKTSRFKSSTVINLTETSRLIYTDILCAGRIAHGERFEFDEYFTRTELYENGRLIFLDGMRPRKNARNESIGYFEGYTHQGLMVLFGIDAALPETELECGISRIGKLSVVRAFSDSAQKLTDLFDKICREAVL